MVSFKLQVSFKRSPNPPRWPAFKSSRPRGGVFSLKLGMVGPLKVGGVDVLTCFAGCRCDAVHVYYFLCVFLAIIFILTKAISHDKWVQL